MQVYLLLESLYYLKRFAEDKQNQQLVDCTNGAIDELNIIKNEDCEGVNMVG